MYFNTGSLHSSGIGFAENRPADIPVSENPLYIGIGQL
jgi:hypothetical protein